MPELKDKVDHLGHTVRDQAGKVADKSKDAASNVVGAVKETFNEVTSGVADMAGKTANQVRDTAKEWMGAAEGATMDAAKTVQHAANDAAVKMGDLSDDLAKVIKNNPIPSVLAALGIGFLAACALRRGSSS